MSKTKAMKSQGFKNLGSDYKESMTCTKSLINHFKNIHTFYITFILHTTVEVHEV